jgi:hypothetical protein
MRSTDGLAPANRSGGRSEKPAMTRRFVWLAAALAIAPAARAQNTAAYAPLTLNVACGELFDPVCAKVLPKIAARAGQAGLNPRAVQSGGALDTAAVVCAGQVAAAIAPRDAIAQLSREPGCLGRYDIVGPALYPLYALLVVKAGAPFRQFDDLARDGRHATIAAGETASAGQATLGFLMRANPPWHNVITVTEDEFADASGQIDNGTIDGFFAVAPLTGDLIGRARLRRDARGTPLYNFIDVRPPPELFRMSDGSGHCLYRLTALDFGGPEPVTTVSTDAVLMLGRAFRDSHARGGPRAADVLASAIEASRAAILAEMRSPGDWRPAANSCQ